MSNQVNLSYLKDNFGNDEEFLKEMLSTMSEELPERFEKLGTAVDNNNPEEVHQIAHSIKSSVQMLGLSTLHEKILLLENAGKNNKNMLEYKDVMAQANALFSKAHADIESLL